MSNESDFIIKNGVLTKYVGPGGDVIIPEGVTEIGEAAFCKAEQIGLRIVISPACEISTIKFPHGLKKIGKNAFYWHKSLICVEFPDTLNMIGDNAFSGCGIESIVIPDSVTSIGKSAFDACSCLSSLSINSDIRVARNAFDRCSRLISLYVGRSVSEISKNILDIQSLSTITVDSENGSYIAQNGALLSKDGKTLIRCLIHNSSYFTIPNGVTIIGDYAFFGYRSLDGVTIPDGVTIIGDSAFQFCEGLTSVTIPGTVTTIGNDAFEHCKNLGSVTIQEGVTTIGDSAFFGCKSLTSVTIPASVTTIGDAAFSWCEGMNSVTISGYKTTIGSSAFSFCKSLRDVIFPNGVAASKATMFDYSDALRITIPDLSALPTKFKICAALCFAEDGGLSTDPRFASHEKYLKANAAKLVETAVKSRALLTLLCRERWIKAKDVEAFLAAAQQAGDAEQIAILLDYQNNTLTAKEKEKASKQKEKQEDAVFDRSVARMNKDGIAGLNFVITGDLVTFSNRKELKEFIEKKGGKLLSSISSKTDYLIMNNSASNSEKRQKAGELGIEIIREEQFNEMAGGQFRIDENGMLVKYWGSGGAVVIPDGVTAIGDAAFCNCKSLTDVTIPNSVTEIGYAAFGWCEGLTGITIPDSVTSIGEQAFIGCVNLTKLVLPNSVTTIGDSAFLYCVGLADDRGLLIVRNVLYGYYGSKSSVIIPDRVTIIGGSAFSWCERLTNVTIPRSVTSIDKTEFFFHESITIHAPADSYAETYAKEHNIPFVAE